MSSTSLGRSASDTPSTDYSDVPETKSLLPPLPDTILKPSRTLQDSSIQEHEDKITSPRHTTSAVFSTPPRRTTSRFNNALMNTPSTPQQLSTTTPGMSFGTPRTTLMFPSSPADNQTPHGMTNASTHTPGSHTKSVTSSPFSPVIPVDERFGVSLAEPEAEPSSPMEMLRHYEKCQRTQDAEFEKTCESLKKSGWMSEKEIMQLEKAKRENWRRWEAKLIAVRKEVGPSRENSNGRFNFSKGLNYHQSGTGSPTQRDRLNGLGISNRD